MKRILFLSLFLIFSISVFAQNNSFIINENFDSADMPEGWYFMGEGADNFSISITNNAGGDANELYFKSKPYTTSGIHLVMGSADLTDATKLGISFKHYLNNDQQSSTIGIATSSDSGTTWNTAWSKTYSDASSSGQYEINEIASTPDMGKNNVLICLFFEGNTYNFNKWYFDDINILALTSSEGNDLQVSRINVNNIIPTENVDITFTVDNVGSTDVTSFEASYEIEEGNIITETFNVNIAPFNNKDISFKTKANILPGTHEISINIVSVNGETDVNTDNNSMTKEVRTFIKAVERTPMIEHFSSATCINCIPVDTTLLNLTHNNEGRYTYVKYPFNYPLPGDKYYLADCGVRSQYYGVTGVPSIFFDGTTSTKQPKQSNFDERYDVPSYIDIVGAFDVKDNTINVTADIASYIDIPNVKVFATVNEKTTVGNVIEGSLPEFHHILMNMLSGNEGIDANFEAGKYQRYEFSYDMSETNVEEMNDLEVAVWVQSYDSKEIYNSNFLNEYSAHPYPVQNLKIEEKTISWDAPEEGSPIGYNVYVNNKLVAEKTEKLSYTLTNQKGNLIVEVVALYENETTSVGIITTAKSEGNNGDEINVEELTSSFNIYPNPVSDKLYIETEVEIKEVAIYTITGVLVGQQTTDNRQQTLSIDVTNLNSGVYFVKVVTNDGEVVKRIVKN